MSVYSAWITSVLKCLLFVLLFTQGSSSKFFGNSSSNFVERCRRDCAIQRDAVICGRYRVVRWLQDAKEKEFSYGPFKLVRLPSLEDNSMFPKLPKVNETNNSLVATLSFVRDAAEDMLTKRALVYTVEPTTGARSLSSGPIVVDEDEFSKMKLQKEGTKRLFKKKKMLLFPILILLKLLKLKLLILPIFLGVHFIKKMLVIGTLLIPSILSHLKICKVAPHYPAPQAWATAAEAPVDYPTGYGHDEAPWIHRNDIYSGHQAGYSNPFGGYFQGR
ncbi:uncharacterized protein LOC117168256 [Belonocnema kinseyi]|uniref:uncharacterized protein LOC117168256 n=1 Tax=Belonocnema kinseyi TaxID=2817044 RepID=UPI00143D2713|nr:uncharacterized protein LOC117168256 [Belonocnema kinseyi]